MTSTQERPASFAPSWKKLRFPATLSASSRRLVVGSRVEALVKLDGPSLTCDSTLDVRCPTLIHEVHRHRNQIDSLTAETLELSIFLDSSRSKNPFS